MFTLSQMPKINLILATSIVMSLTGCAKQTEQVISYSAADRAEEKKQSLKALKSCFFRNYLNLEEIHKPAIRIASQIRSICEFEFRHLRAVKLNYAPVPDINSPPKKVQEDEISLVTTYVVQKRQFFSSQFEIEQLKRQHPHSKNIPPETNGI